MFEYETIGVNTTVKYPEVKLLLNHWITPSAMAVTPGHDNDILEYMTDGEFDKYISVNHHNREKITKWCENVHRPIFYEQAYCKPRGGYPPGVLSFGGVSSITTAADLAKHLGATQCILVGSDFIGPYRQDGSMCLDNYGAVAKKSETYFKNCGIEVYKTNVDSPINLPLWS